MNSIICKETPKQDVIDAAKCVRDCKACQNGCKYGSGCFVDGELPALAKFLGVSEDALKKKYLQQADRFNTKLWKPKLKGNGAYGKCIFFDSGCTIHEVKPLECKTAVCRPIGEKTSQWFMLNHCVNPNDAESVRQFALYLKLGYPTLEDGNIENIIKDKKKLRKMLNYEL